MTYYQTCSFCGSNLDPGEKCECQIKDDCNYCHYFGNKNGYCYVCSLKGNGKYNLFHNRLLPRSKRRIHKDGGVNFI